MASKRRESHTQGHGIASHKTCNRYNTAVKTTHFAEVQLLNMYEQLTKELNTLRTGEADLRF